MVNFFSGVKEAAIVVREDFLSHECIEAAGRELKGANQWPVLEM